MNYKDGESDFFLLLGSYDWRTIILVTKILVQFKRLDNDVSIQSYFSFLERV